MTAGEPTNLERDNPELALAIVRDQMYDRMLYGVDVWYGRKREVVKVKVKGIRWVHVAGDPRNEEVLQIGVFGFEGDLLPRWVAEGWIFLTEAKAVENAENDD